VRIGIDVFESERFHNAGKCQRSRRGASSVLGSIAGIGFKERSGITARQKGQSAKPERRA
jgi:hypothetical protein